MKEVIIKSKIVGKEGAIGGGKPIAFPDLSAYALRSDFIRLESSFNDFLNGDDTDNVINRWKELEAFLNNISEDYNLLSLLNGKADKATTLRGYGITDAYTKTNVDDLLKSYVTLGGTPQTITGEKNFTGGLKVNGSPIYYDTEKKYWKLEGDLLVTGGVTMYGSDSSFTPSTIMDAIVVDNVTIIKQDGKLVAIGGGSSGGVADAVAWGNVLGKPSWITDTTPSISISGTSVSLGGSITQSALRAALGLGSNAYTSTAYLPLSGGTMGGNIVFQGGYLRFTNSSGSFLGAYNVNDSGDALYLKGSAWNKILHSGNYSEYALPLSGGTLSGNLTIQNTSVDIITLHRASNSGSPSIKFTNKSDGTLGYMGVSDSSRGLQPFFMDTGSSIFKIWHEGNDGSGSGLDADLLDGRDSSGFAIYEGVVGANSASGVASIGYTYATQEHGGLYAGGFINFGTNGYFCQLNGNVSQSALAYRFYNTEYGKFSDWKSIAFTDSNVASATKLQTARTIWGQSFDGTGNVSGTLELGASSVRWHNSNSYSISCPTTSVSARLQYHADDGHIFKTAANTDAITILRGGNVGIGTTSPSAKLHVSGDILATGGITTNDSVEINGIKLSKSKDGVLYLDGNLVVKGGVTMYGTDATSSPSILDSLPIASTSSMGIAQFNPSDFAVKDGVVSFVGSVDGGVASSVSWGNITGKPTFATVATSGKYSDLSGLPTIPTSLKNPYSLTINNSGGTAQVTYDGSAAKSLSLTKAMVGLGNVENTALSTWTGTNKITTLGTISSGTWNGSKIVNAYLANSSVTISGESVSLGGSITQSALRSALGLGSNAYTSTAYLPLSGGVLSSSTIPLVIKSTSSYTGIEFNTGTHAAYFRYKGDSTWQVTDNGWNATYDLWHSGNFTPSNYLPLSGGTLSGNLTIQNTSVDIITLHRASNSGSPSIKFTNKSDGTLGYMGVSDSSRGLQPFFMDTGSSIFKIWHEGNDGSGSGLDADLLDGKQPSDLNVGSATQVMINYSYNQDINYPLVFTSRDNIGSAKNGGMYIDYYGRPTYNPKTDTLTVGNLLGNASSATKLESNDSYTAWGQTFFINGKPNNIYGTAYFPNGDLIYAKDEGGANQYILGFTSSLGLGYGSAGAGYDTYILGNNIHFRYSTSRITGFTLNSSGNVGIGTTSPTSKLHVSGDVKVTGSSLLGSYVYINTNDVGIYFGPTSINMHNASNNYSASLIGFSSSSITMYQNTTVQGNILATGGITMYSMRALKNVVDERGLSLSELSTIKPTRYTWKDGRDTRLHFGGIADDIQQVLPEVVYKTSDGILTMDYGNAAFAVASSLIQPVVDHEKRIAMLEEENKQLRQEVERLKSA